ncbi:MAG: hypothetical protein AAB011_01085, partial [Candidatus Eisenbacteria bacterium]
MNGTRQGRRIETRGAAVMVVIAGLVAGGLVTASPAGAQTRGKKEPAPATEKTAAARDVAVTVYNDNLGVVKDRRPFTLAAGISDLRFT